MKFLGLAGMAALLLTTTSLKAADPNPFQDLIGIWVLESTSFKGQVPNKKSIEEAPRLVVLDTGDFFYKNPGVDSAQMGVLAVDPESNPKSLDIHTKFFVGRNGNPVLNPAVYEVQGDTLIWSKVPANTTRPKDLEPSPNSVVQIFRRLK